MKMTSKCSAAALVVFTYALISLAAVKPDFSGTWNMDRARSFGLPANMNQTMIVTHKGDQIDVETKLIQPDNERTVKDVFLIDGKEHDFTPQPPPGQTNVKGKRTANWLPASNGITVTDVVIGETKEGQVTSQIVRKWTMSNQGELVIDMYVDSANGSYETKRIFKRK